MHHGRKTSETARVGRGYLRYQEQDFPARKLLAQHHDDSFRGFYSGQAFRIHVAKPISRHSKCDRSSTYRKLISRPNLGDIKRVKFEFHWVSFFRLHNLNICGPFNFLPLFNCFPKIPLGIIRIDTTDFFGFRGSELFLTMFRKKVILDVYKFAFRIDPESISHNSEAKRVC